MNPELLAVKLASLQHWMGREIALRQTLLYPDKPWPVPRMIADASVVIDPGNSAEYPSLNPNHVEHFGTSGLAGKQILDEIIDLYRGAGCARFFVYVSPSRQAPDLERWLQSAGLEQVVELAVMWRAAEQVGNLPSPFDLRACLAEEADLLHDFVLDDPFRSVSATLDMLGEPGFHTLVATKCGKPASTGSLYVQRDLGYLGNGKTLESYRKQGGQSALISARINLAATLGCRDVVSETYWFLPSSYDNLLRAGFEELYSRSIYRWEAS